MAGSDTSTGMQRYTRVASLLHWLIAALVLVQIGLGLTMDHVTLDDMVTFSLFQTHRALGMITLVLVVLRVVWRLRHKPPVLPASETALMRHIASMTHALLYAGQVLSPLSGWALASASSLALPLSMFGLFDWPLLPLSADGRFEDPLRLVHHWAGWGFAALIALHIGAALWHGVVMRDGLVWRIIPFSRPASKPK
ncbi:MULTISPECIES: cytochrome b [Asaia]|uniref:cytochrome b n=1 Tax=Asaia TaxID=91914 RepID=UPI002FC3B787